MTTTKWHALTWIVMVYSAGLGSAGLGFDPAHVRANNNSRIATVIFFTAFFDSVLE